MRAKIGCYTLALLAAVATVGESAPALALSSASNASTAASHRGAFVRGTGELFRAKLPAVHFQFEVRREGQSRSSSGHLRLAVAGADFASVNPQFLDLEGSTATFYFRGAFNGQHGWTALALVSDSKPDYLNILLNSPDGRQSRHYFGDVKRGSIVVRAGGDLQNP